MVTLQLHVACAQHSGQPSSLEHCNSSQTERARSKCLSLTFKGAELALIASISWSVIEAVSLIQIHAHLWRREFYIPVERAVKLSLLQTETHFCGQGDLVWD